MGQSIQSRDGNFLIRQYAYMLSMFHNTAHIVTIILVLQHFDIIANIPQTYTNTIKSILILENSSKS